MAEEELQIEEGGKKSKMMLFIIIGVVVLLGGGAAAYFLLFAGGDEPTAEEQLAEGSEAVAAEAAPKSTTAASIGDALYVQMPRPFDFNVPGASRSRLVQIRVQLLVRGSDNEEKAQMHIPSIEGALLQVFNASNADDLVTPTGKEALREDALVAVQAKMTEITGGEVVDKVLFTGFVMQ